MYAVLIVKILLEVRDSVIRPKHCAELFRVTVGVLLLLGFVLPWVLGTSVGMSCFTRVSFYFCHGRIL
jgi:energy-converting hydrogenase Eha subunit F